MGVRAHPHTSRPRPWDKRIPSDPSCRVTSSLIFYVLYVHGELSIDLVACSSRRAAEALAAARYALGGRVW